MAQIPMSGNTINAMPSPIAAGRPDVMNAVAMRPSMRKYTTSARQKKPIKNWVRST